MLRKADYLNSASVVHEIEIKYENGITEITLPCLLPKRRKSQGSEFLSDPLFAALRSYTDKNPIAKYKHCVVCFSHIYNRGTAVKANPGLRQHRFEAYT